MLTAALALVALAQDAELPVLRPGEFVEGVIDDGDPVIETDALRDGGYTQDHAVLGETFLVEVDEPGIYRIELRSYFFDSYLVLRSASGDVLAEDDDGLIGTHSRVVRELSPGDAARMDLCALHGGRGRYELRLERGEPPSLSAPERTQVVIEDARRGLEAREAVLGPSHPDVASSLNNLALLLKGQGDYAAARPLYERALAIREEVLGPDHPRVAQSLGNLALLLEAQGDYAAPRPLHERGLAICEAALGPDHPDVATCLDNLAGLLETQGDYAAARPLSLRALAIREAALGPDHPDVASSLNNLAFLLQAQGDYAEARPLYERALAIDESVFGPDHPDVAIDLNNLALLLEAQGDQAAARPLHERALAIREAALGPDHRAVATSLNNLARLLDAQGDQAAARPLHERALAIWEAALGPDHPLVATSLNNLASLLVSQGNSVAARPLYERALAIREVTLGPAHPDVATSLANLAHVLESQGDYTAARALAERALAIREAQLGPMHPDVAISLGHLALLSKAQGDYAAARPLYERALAIWEAAFGPTHPDLATAINNLALLLWSQGDSTAARPLLERAIALWEVALGPAHPAVADGLNDLAGLLADQGTLADAVAVLERADRTRPLAVGRNLAGLGEGESHVYLAQSSWQQELRLSSLAWGAAPVSVYESLLAWKAQVLRLARLRREQLAASLEPGVLEKLRHLQGIQSRLSRSVLASTTEADPLDARQLEALVDERGRLERELQQFGDPLRLQPPTWEEVRAALAERTALVDLFVHETYERAAWEDGQLVRPGRWSEPRVSAWITRPDLDEPLHLDLGTASAIDAAVRPSLQASVEDARGVSADLGIDSNAVLRRLVWDPLLPHLQGVDLVFVSPDGVLATLPFEIICGEDDRYLVQDRGFVYLTDPGLLVETARRGALPDASSLLAAGGVDYGRADESGAYGEELLAQAEPTGSVEVAPDARGRSTAVVTLEEEASGAGVTSGALRVPANDSRIPANDLRAPASDSRIPASDLRKGSWTDLWRPLHATAPEAEQVHTRHELAQPDARRLLLRGAAVTEERLKAELPRHSILHLATHGYFQPEGWVSLEESARAAVEDAREHPWQETFSAVSQRLQGYHPGLLSGLVCAGVNRTLPEERDDGYLTAEEVGWLDLSGVDLAVLSACDTGLGRPQSGEGLIGLRRAFLMAGAKTVVSSLWSVPDQATAEFMDLFYRNLWQRGMGKHEALRAAQLETLERNQALHGHARPATWGAFVLDGNWR